ncbi:MAG TPA: AzlD domain-containing protein [Stellaceae bacterium]|nr:AzlD domain-containing protein [Stellaceae bacterium]
MRAEVLLAFLAMAAVSYGIRLAGYLVGGRMHEHPRLRAALDQLPAAILIALVVPIVTRGGPAEWLAAAVVAALAWYVDLLLIPLAAGVIAVVLLRGFL